MNAGKPLIEQKAKINYSNCMKELELKYGCNPNQKPARVYMENGDLPITVLNGSESVT